MPYKLRFSIHPKRCIDTTGHFYSAELYIRICISLSHFGVVVALTGTGPADVGVVVVDPAFVEHLPLTVVLAFETQSVYDVLGAFSSVAAQMLCPLS